jgi:hypothetical protein
VIDSGEERREDVSSGQPLRGLLNCEQKEETSVWPQKAARPTLGETLNLLRNEDTSSTPKRIKRKKSRVPATTCAHDERRSSRLELRSSAETGEGNRFAGKGGNRKACAACDRSGQ